MINDEICKMQDIIFKTGSKFKMVDDLINSIDNCDSDESSQRQLNYSRTDTNPNKQLNNNVFGQEVFSMDFKKPISNTCQDNNPMINTQNHPYFNSNGDSIDSELYKKIDMNRLSVNFDNYYASNNFYDYNVNSLSTSKNSFERSLKDLEIQKKIKQANIINSRRNPGTYHTSTYTYLTDSNVTIVKKKFHCKIGDCQKVYKSINGLRYHNIKFHKILKKISKI